MKLYKALTVLVGSLLPFLCTGTPTMSLHIRPYPQTDKPSEKKLTDDIKIPGKLTRKVLKYFHVHPGGTEGVLTSYMGFVGVSSFDGHTSYIRRHKEPAVKLLITQAIEPIMMLSNVVHHWEIKPGIPAKMYTVERKQDEQTKLYYWDTKEAELPENNRISLDTIVLFAKPDSVVVPTGATLTQGEQQLVLPPIYTKKSFGLVPRTLAFLKLRHFFGPQIYKRQAAKDGVAFSRQLLP